MSRKKDGTQLFEQFYSGLYKDRWPALKAAFLNESSPVSLSDSLLTPYYMDRASIIAASCLPVKEGDDVLDMCAAPGGKTLVLALKLKGTGSLTSNDRSAARRTRLKNTVEDCLPKEWNNNIRITGHDASTWGLFEQNRYDCVLLDAPCSSERHVINDATALSEWSENRPKRLAIQQFAMLAAALTAVKPRGFILYSTCSVCSLENEDVIEKLSRKRPGAFTEIELGEIENTEKLSHGQIILPDKSSNLGPLYFCLIQKEVETC